MVVSSALNIASLDELAHASKSKPGTLSYSALAIPMQITIENWKKKTGADLVYVPVRGGGDMVNGLLTGTTPVAIVGLPNFYSVYPQRRGQSACRRFGKALGVISRCADPGRARISEPRAGLFCLCRSGGYAASNHCVAPRRDRG